MFGISRRRARSSHLPTTTRIIRPPCDDSVISVRREVAKEKESIRRWHQPFRRWLRLWSVRSRPMRGASKICPSTAFLVTTGLFAAYVFFFRRPFLARGGGGYVLGGGWGQRGDRIAADGSPGQIARYARTADGPSPSEFFPAPALGHRSMPVPHYEFDMDLLLEGQSREIRPEDPGDSEGGDEDLAPELDAYYAFDDDAVRASLWAETDTENCRRSAWHRLLFPSCNMFHEMSLIDGFSLDAVYFIE